MTGVDLDAVEEMIVSRVKLSQASLAGNTDFITKYLLLPDSRPKLG